MDSTAIPTPITPITKIPLITPIFNKINDIYTKTTYLEKYGGSLIFTIFAILIVLFYFIYLSIQNNKELIKKDWAINKCNPLYMPFAGTIMEPKDMSNMEFTIQNFSQCSEIMLKDIIQVALAPIEFAFILISAFVSILTGVVTSLMGAIASFRNTGIKKESKKALEKQTMFASILSKLTTKIKDTLNKGEGVLTTILFVFISAYKAGASVFHAILLGETIIVFWMLIGLVAAWVLWLLLMLILFGTAFKWIVIPIALTIIYIVFTIILLVLILFTASVIVKSGTGFGSGSGRVNKSFQHIGTTLTPE